MLENKPRDITVGVASRDPYFIFATRALLGRDRDTRIFNTAASLKSLRLSLRNMIGNLQAVVCDLDSITKEPDYFKTLHETIKSDAAVKVLCLAEGMLEQSAPEIGDIPVSAFLSKFELRYCLHLAVRAVVDREAVLVTPSSKKLLKDGSYLKENSRTILPEKPHPNLSNRIQEVVVWRILIGLDNPDIEDELLLSPDTVREYVSKGYKSLGVNNEIDAFNVLSDWWWMTRFSPALK